MLYFHFKKAIKNKLFIVLYILFIGFLIIVGHQRISMNVSSLKIDVCVFDEDQTEKSHTYIANLKKRELLHVEQVGLQNGKNHLMRGTADVLIHIPKDYFKNVDAHKLTFYYATTNAVAPAMSDILALDILPTQMSQHLVKATQLYIKTISSEKAKQDYLNTYSRLDKNLKVKLVTSGILKGLKSEKDLILINNFSGELAFSLTLIILIICYPLALYTSSEMNVKWRLLTISNAAKRYFRTQRIVLLSFVIFPWMGLVISGKHTLNYHSTVALSLFFTGIIISLIYFEGFIFIMNKHFSFFTQLLSIAFVLIPAILGGAFFDIDLLPQIIKDAFLPFNRLNAIFYAGVVKGGFSKITLLTLTSYLVIYLVLLIINQRGFCKTLNMRTENITLL